MVPHGYSKAFPSELEQTPATSQSQDWEEDCLWEGPPSLDPRSGKPSPGRPLGRGRIGQSEACLLLQSKEGLCQQDQAFSEVTPRHYGGRYYPGGEHG